MSYLFWRNIFCVNRRGEKWSQSRFALIQHSFVWPRDPVGVLPDVQHMLRWPHRLEAINQTVTDITPQVETASAVRILGLYPSLYAAVYVFLKNNMIYSHHFILALRTTLHFNIFACIEHKLLSTLKQLLEFGKLFFFSQGYSFEEIVNKKTFVCDILSRTKVTMSKIFRLFSGSNDILWYRHCGTLVHNHTLNAHLNCDVISYVLHLYLPVAHGNYMEALYVGFTYNSNTPRFMLYLAFSKPGH